MCESPLRDPAQTLDALHALRVGVTVFDAAGRLTFANAHLNYFFRNLPAWNQLIGMHYGALIR